MSIRQTNRNTVIAPASSIVAGVMFKHANSWYLAREKSREAAAEAVFDWTVAAIDRHGRNTLVALYAQEVEVARPKYVPPTFTPAHIKREAARVERQAQALQDQAASMRRLAAACELAGM